MDWAKAKSILVVIFLLLNIFLGAYITAQKTGAGTTGKVIDDAKAILEARGVTVECKIPTFSGRAREVSFEDTRRINRNIITSRLLGTGAMAPATDIGMMLVNGSRSIAFTGANSFIFTDGSPAANREMNNLNGAEKQLKKMIRELGLPANSEYGHYKASTLSDGEMKIVFIDKYEGLLVFGNLLTAVITQDGGIKSLSFEYNGIRNLDNGSLIKVLPAYQVLLKNHMAIGKSVITEIELGYSFSNVSGEVKGIWEKPVWRIKRDGDKVEDFNAYTGDRIVTPVK